MGRAVSSVAWFAPGRKRPVATSTVASSDLIAALATDGATVRQIRDRINWDSEAQVVCDAYIRLGFGDEPLDGSGTLAPLYQLQAGA